MNHIISRSCASNNKPVGGLHEKRSFLAFSRQTLDIGRKVYIDADLLPKFLSLVNTLDYDGLMVTRHITQLRATAGGIKSNTSVSSSTLCMDRVKHVQIIYEIGSVEYEKGKTKTSENSVYITDIRPAYGSDNVKAGLYAVDRIGRPKTDIPLKHVYQDAAVMSGGNDSHIVAAAKKGGKQVRQTFGTDKEYSMFYSPSYLYNDLGAWITPEMKNYSPLEAAQKLARYLEETERQRARNKQNKVLWLVTGESSKLLKLAVDKVQGHLSTQSFKFVDPTTDISQLLKTLSKKHAHFLDDPEHVVTLSNTNTASQVAMAKLGANIAGTVGSLLNNLSASENIKIVKDTNQLRIKINAAMTATNNKDMVNTNKDGKMTITNQISKITFMDLVNKIQQRQGHKVQHGEGW